MREECTSFAEKLTGLFTDIVIRTMTVQLLRDLDELGITFAQLQALTGREILQFDDPHAALATGGDEAVPRKDLGVVTLGAQ